MNFHDAHGRAVKDYFYKTRYDQVKKTNELVIQNNRNN